MWALLGLHAYQHADPGSRRMFARSGAFLDISALAAIRHVRTDVAAGAALRTDGMAAPYVIGRGFSPTSQLLAAMGGRHRPICLCTAKFSQTESVIA